MATRHCDACVEQPFVRCGRCTETRCQQHAFRAGLRCERCEHDYRDDEPTRRAAKLIFAPPVAILSGGILFGMLLPVSLIGMAALGVIACATAFGAGAGTCTLVDRSSRALFLRERCGALPEARLLPSRVR